MRKVLEEVLNRSGLQPASLWTNLILISQKENNLSHSGNNLLLYRIQFVISPYKKKRFSTNKKLFSSPLLLSPLKFNFWFQPFVKIEEEKKAAEAEKKKIEAAEKKKRKGAILLV